MFLAELWNYEEGEFKDDPRYNPENDKFSTREEGHTRKTRLTLMQVNKIRKMQDVRKFEQIKDLKLIRKQYGAVPDEAGSDMF